MSALVTLACIGTMLVSEMSHTPFPLNGVLVINHDKGVVYGSLKAPHVRNVESPESIYAQIAFEDAAVTEWENRSPQHCTGRETGKINRISGEVTADRCALATSGRFLNAHIEATCSLKAANVPGRT
jgi:hypothetical protein